LDTKGRSCRRYTYHGYYLSTVGRRSRRPRHAKKGDTVLRTAVRTCAAWAGRQRERLAAWGARAVRATRDRLVRAFSRRTLARYSTYLSAAAGVAIVVLSVYLVRLGWLAPEPVTIGPTPPVSEEGLPPGGAGGGEEAGLDGSRAGAGDEGGPAAGEAAPGESAGADPAGGVAGSGEEAGLGIAPETGPEVGAGTGSPPTTEGVQPVIDLEGQDEVVIGPTSLGECLEALVAPARGEVLRSMGYYYSDVLAEWRYHSGTDVALDEGEPVRAALDGLVVDVSRTKLLGGRVVINHGCGLVTEYEHLGTIRVTEGQVVQTGEVLGEAGRPGAIEADLGVHLHFTVRVDGEPVDPEDHVDF